MHHEVIAEAAGMLRKSLEDEIPLPFNIKDDYARVYQRTIELQIEQLKAIESLYQNGLFRPAYAILRSILEAMGTLLWVSTNINRYCPLFEERKQPNTKEILQRIGWGAEYDRTFSCLSGFVHVDFENAEFYREYELETDSSIPFPEVLPDSEYYVIQTNNGPLPLSIRFLSYKEAQRRYGPYLATKAFDIVAATLARLYGSQYYNRDWWSQKAALQCTEIVTANSGLSEKMIWSIQMRLDTE